MFREKGLPELAGLLFSKSGAGTEHPCLFLARVLGDPCDEALFTAVPWGAAKESACDSALLRLKWGEQQRLVTEKVGAHGSQ